MLEKRYPAVPPQSFTSDGTANGIITVPDSTLFKVKQDVQIAASTLPTLKLEVKEVLNATQMVIGPDGGAINITTDLSAYTVALSSVIFCATEQKRPPINFDEYDRATYEEEPVVARRSVLVDSLGNKIASTIDSFGNTRLAVDAEVTVDTVQLFTKPYDTITALYPLATQEVYQTRIGGITGAIQQTATVNYTDSSKNFILNVVRT